MKKILMFCLMVLFTLLFSVLVYAIPTYQGGSSMGVSYGETTRLLVLNPNDLSRGVPETVAYNFGYKRAYGTVTNGKSPDPYWIFSSRRITGFSPDTYEATYHENEVAFAKRERGKYITGYRKGLNDARKGIAPKVSDDFLEKYGFTQRSVKKNTVFPQRILSNSGSFLQKYGLTETMSAAEMGAYVGEKDASDGLGKAPTRVVDQLRSLTSIRANRIYKIIYNDKGDFLNAYTKAYILVSALPEKKSSFSEKRPQSQKPENVKREDAVALGAKLGREHALMGLPKRPYDIIDSPWKSFTKVSSHDIAVAKGDKTNYLRAYYEAYDQINAELVTVRKSWDIRLEELGCEHGIVDAQNAKGSRPHYYVNQYKRSARTRAELDIAGYLRTKTGRFVKGYKTCYASY